MPRWQGWFQPQGLRSRSWGRNFRAWSPSIRSGLNASSRPWMITASRYASRRAKSLAVALAERAGVCVLRKGPGRQAVFGGAWRRVESLLDRLEGVSPLPETVQRDAAVERPLELIGNSEARGILEKARRRLRRNTIDGGRQGSRQTPGEATLERARDGLDARCSGPNRVERTASVFWSWWKDTTWRRCAHCSVDGPLRRPAGRNSRNGHSCRAHRCLSPFS